MIFLDILANLSSDILPDFTAEIAQINLWFKGLGIIAILWVFYSASIFWINRKNAKNLDSVKKDLDEANKKLDKLIKRK